MGRRVALLGNSGSGKSTLAAWLAERSGLPLLDLDTVAWESGEIAVARPVGAAEADVRDFCGSRSSWVVEGCYANLVGQALAYSPTLVFLDPGEAQCLANCRRRPWEPHKYPTRAQQDERLPYLLEWVSEYYMRGGPMSYSAHRRLYADYEGSKLELTTMPDLQCPPDEILGLIE